MSQFWCLLLTGIAGGVLLGLGEFAAAAVLAAWAVWGCHRHPRAPRGLVSRSLEFFLLAGLVFYYRGSLKLELLALCALLGAFIDAHTTVISVAAARRDEPAGALARVRLLSLAAAFATVTEWFFEGSDPVLGHPLGVPLVAALLICSALSHYQSACALKRIVLAARKRRRAWQRLALAKPRLAIA